MTHNRSNASRALCAVSRARTFGHLVLIGNSQQVQGLQEDEKAAVAAAVSDRALSMGAPFSEWHDLNPPNYIDRDLPVPQRGA